MELQGGNGWRHISDEIGEEYKSWGSENIIFIMAPTGSGKSHFILYTFLPRMIREKKRILYLVNRKVLRDQLQEELLQEVADKLYVHSKVVRLNVERFIEISTYQTLEAGLKGPKPIETIKFVRGFDCVVCDEAHYFCSDSNFNTSTELSYACIRKEFENKIQIFMSATLDKTAHFIEDQLLDDTPELSYYQPQKPDYYQPSKPSLFQKSVKNEEDDKIKFYCIEPKYDNVDLEFFEEPEELCWIITEKSHKKEKWLVFVDSIELGKTLEEILISEKRIHEEQENEDGGSNLTDEDVVFIDAEYKKRDDSFEAVREIIEKKCFGKKVVIATSVLDNGVSIKDIDLRNIAIWADTQEEFIQMLGRKRRGTEKIKLFICKRSIDHFKKRLRTVKGILKCYSRYQKKLDKMKIRYSSMKLNSYAQFQLQYEVSRDKTAQVEQDEWTVRSERARIMYEQQEILDNLLSDDRDNQYLRKFCYSAGGIISENEFSLLQLRELSLFYKEIIQELEKDEDAFAKKQGSWLGMSNDKIVDAIKKSKEEECARHRKILEPKILEVLDKSMSGEENKKWKNDVRKQLLYFLKEREDYSSSDEIGITRNDRTITAERFNRCMEQAGLPYEMLKSYNEPYEIIRKEEE